MRLMALLTALTLVGLLTGSQAYAEEMLAWGGGTAACAKINPLIPPGTGWGNDVLTGGDDGLDARFYFRHQHHCF